MTDGDISPTNHTHFWRHVRDKVDFIDRAMELEATWFFAVSKGPFSETTPFSVDVVGTAVPCQPSHSPPNVTVTSKSTRLGCWHRELSTDMRE